MKRFYKLVSTRAETGGFAVLLDGKPVKTPGGSTLLAGNERIADKLLKEWAVQDEKIDPQSMPLTQILTTKIDRVAVDRHSMTVPLLKYLDTDLLCYRAPKEEEEKLAVRQAALWNAPLTWFAEKFGSSLEVTSGLKALRQPEAAHKAVKDYIQSLDDDRFTILQIITPLCGSLVLGLAFIEGEIGAVAVFAAAHVEEAHKAEIYNEGLYGAAPHEEKSRAAMRRDLAAAEQYLSVL